VNDFDRELPALTVPDDLLLTSGEFAKAKEAHQALLAGQVALKKSDAAAALAAAEKAEANNPGFYQNATLRGRALLALNRPAEAAPAFAAALAAQPAFQTEKLELESLLKQAQGTK